MALTSARVAVLRSFVVFTPFLIIVFVALAFLVSNVADEGAGAGNIVALVLVSLVSLLLAYQVVQSVRDLFAQPVETTGLVDRHWERHDMFIFRNDYIFVEGNVFRLSPEQAVHVDLGDTVRVRHLPHTSSVESVDVVEHAGRRHDA